MGAQKPHRYEVIDKEFPVRLSIRADPATHRLTNAWLVRHVGAENYASRPHRLWTATRAHCVYFRTLYDAQRFLLGCPHVQLIAEQYDGRVR